MQEIIHLVGPQQAVEILGTTLVGGTVENGTRLLVTLVFVAVVLLLERVGAGLVRLGWRRGTTRTAFWVRPALRLSMVVVLLLGLAALWFEDPAHLAIVVALVTAGLAVALQRVVTAVVGYFLTKWLWRERMGRKWRMRLVHRDRARERDRLGGGAS